MITIISKNDGNDNPVPKDGDVYKTLSVGGRCFTLLYGYYEEFEREYNDPIPIYPDFLRNPVFAEDGTPIVTAMQSVCKYYIGKSNGNSCGECGYFENREELIGLCNSPKKRKLLTEKGSVKNK